MDAHVNKISSNIMMPAIILCYVFDVSWQLSKSQCTLADQTAILSAPNLNMG